MEDMVILLSGDSGAYATIDPEDYILVKDKKWYLSNGYAVTAYGEKMHRVINGTPDEMHTDHVNHVRLDNRRANLRTATLTQNSHNRQINENNKSGYKGVSWHRASQKWTAQIHLDGKVKYLGVFEKKIEAAKAYNEAAIKHYGEFAYINKESQ